MVIALFILYFLGFCYLLTRIKFVAENELRFSTILSLFTIKIAAGIVLGYISFYLFNGLTDYQATNNYGIQEYYSLFNTPQTFFTDIFQSNYNDKGEFFGSGNSYWNDLRFNIIYKVLAITNIFSRGNYFINSLFFNFVSFVCSFCLYRVFIHIYPTKKWGVIAGCFLLPSTLYFSSGIHKDLIVLAALSVFCYAVYFSLLSGFTAKKIIYIIVSLLTILVVRNFIAVILLPCALVWIICKRYRFPIIKGFAFLFATGLIGILTTQYFFKRAELLNIVVKKQQAFFSLGKARTDYKMDSLQPTLKSFVQEAPGALRRCFLSPYPGEFNHFYMSLFSVEITIYWVLFLIILLFYRKHLLIKNDFILFGIVFTFFIFLFTGYITTNAGSLVRYRSIYFPFLITPLLCSLDWQKIYLSYKKAKAPLQRK